MRRNTLGNRKQFSFDILQGYFNPRKFEFVYYFHEDGSAPQNELKFKE